MAVKADKNPPEVNSYIQRIVDFSGGLNKSIKGSLLNSNEAQESSDVSYEQKGTIRPRKGRVKRYAAVFDAAPCSGLGRYYKADGTSMLVMTAGTKVFSDSPHFSKKWTTKEEWENANAALYGYGSSSDIEGSIIGRSQLLGVKANCEDISLWTVSDVTLTLDANCVYRDACIKAAIDATKSDGKMYAGVIVDDTKYAVLSAYIKNYDVTTGIRLIALDDADALIVNSAYSTGTEWTKVQLKIPPSYMATLAKVGIQMTGVAAQYAFVDGLYLTYITSAEYADSSYVAPDYDYFDVVPEFVEYTEDADFDAGTHDDTDAVSDTLKLAAEIPAFSEIDTVKDDFDLGTVSDTSTSIIIDAISLDYL